MVGSDNLTLFEVNEAAEIIKKAVDPEANIIFGVVHDSRMDKDVKITLIATGFEVKNQIAGLGQDDGKVEEFLKEWKTEDQLDIPSFLRRPMYNQRNLSNTAPKVGADYKGAYPQPSKGAYPQSPANRAPYRPGQR